MAPRSDRGDGVVMFTRLLESVTGLQAQAGWDDVVRSLKGAIEDPTHVNILGIALGLMVAVWVNYRIAKWLLGQPRSRSS